MKLIRLLIDFVKVLIFMIFPFISISLVEKLLENISSETIVQSMIIGSIVIAIILARKLKKGDD